jgi:hypothetical protein
MLEHATPVPPSNPANVDTIHARGGTLDEHLATTAAAAKADARTAMTVGSMSLAATNIAGMATAVFLVPGGQIIGLGMTAVSSLTDAKSSMNASRRADALRDVKARTPRLSCDNPGQGHDRVANGVLPYAINQMDKRAERKKLSPIPFVGPLMAAFHGAGRRAAGEEADLRPMRFLQSGSPGPRKYGPEAPPRQYPGPSDAAKDSRFVAWARGRAVVTPSQPPA